MTASRFPHEPPKETCEHCGEPLEPVTTGGWIDIFLVRRSDDKTIRFYGVFSEFEGLQGIFGWIENPEQIPSGEFCRHGHVGISHEGMVTRSPDDSCRPGHVGIASRRAK